MRSSNLRKYYKDNILAFGDLLHKIHPLAGQGFNMSLRDIKLLSDIVDEKINLVLTLLFVVAIGYNYSFVERNQVSATSTVCPNSSVKCKVTYPNGMIVDSEKGKNDPAVIMSADK